MNFTAVIQLASAKLAIVTHRLKGESWKGYVVKPANTTGIYFVSHDALSYGYMEWLPLAHVSIDYVN